MATRREQLEMRHAVLVSALNDGVGREERMRLRAEIEQVRKEIEAERKRESSADGEEDGMVLGFQQSREFGPGPDVPEPATFDDQPESGWTEEVASSAAAVHAVGGQLIEDAHRAAIERVRGGL